MMKTRYIFLIARNVPSSVSLICLGKGMDIASSAGLIEYGYLT